MAEWLEMVWEVSLLVALGYGVRAWYFLWWRPKRLEKELSRQGIHGNPYRLFIGDMKDEMKSMSEAWSKPINLTHDIAPRVAPFAHRTQRIYGKTSLVWSGTTPRIIAGHPEMIREILSNKSVDVTKPQIPPIMKPLGMGLTSLEGEEWAMRRRMINPAFHMEKLKAMVSEFSTSCSDLVQRWGRLVDAEGSCEVDVWPEFQNLTADIISRTAFGSSYEEGKRIFELQREQVKLVIEGIKTAFIPGFRFLPTFKNRRRSYLDREIKAAIREVIQKREESLERGEPSSNDLLGLLLESSPPNIRGHEADSKQKNKLTVEDMTEECKVFYIAGHETTSSMLTWVVIVLALHPDWQQRARDEIIETCGGKAPQYEAINHLKIVTMILHEVLRLYPPVTSLFRHTHEKTRMGEISVPSGVDIVLPTLLVHHDKDLWGEDADEFNPERFLQGASKASKDQGAFFPFGWGPRTCIGQTFAMMEAKMALCTILQRFSFELSPSYSHAPYTVMTLQPQHGALITLRKL